MYETIYEPIDIYSAAPKTPKIDTDDFDGKIQQLITMGISEVRQSSYTVTIGCVVYTAESL